MTQLRLKEFRKKARMTQSDVANILNITQAQYFRLEIGKSLPNSN
jgi:DNA-binding XRE family transcriptional regulator